MNVEIARVHAQSGTVVAEEVANKDLNNVKAWLSSNKLRLNIARTEYILIWSRPKISSIDVQPTVKIDTRPIKRVKCTKLLEVEIEEHNTLVLAYNALMHCCEVWDELDKGLIEGPQKLQNRAARLIMNFQYEHEQSILARTSLGWTSLKERRAVVKARLMYKIVNQLAPLRLCDIFQLSDNVNNYYLRGSSTGLFIPRPRTEFVKKSFSYSEVKLWNRIPKDIGSLVSYDSFCKNLSSLASAFKFSF